MMSSLAVVFLAEPPEIHQPQTANFALIHHWWQAKTKPVRVGPSTEYWELYIEISKEKPLLHFTLDNSPIHYSTVNGIYNDEKNHDMMTRGKEIEEIKPGTRLNPTKATPSYIDQDDQGTVKIYELTDVFGKMDFKGSQWKDHVVFIRTEPDMNLWRIRKEERNP